MGRRRLAEGISGEMCGSQLTSPGRDPEGRKCFHSLEGNTEGWQFMPLCIWGTSLCWVVPHQHRESLRKQEDVGALSGRVQWYPNEAIRQLSGRVCQVAHYGGHQVTCIKACPEVDGGHGRTPECSPRMFSAVPKAMVQGHLILTSQEGTALGFISHEHRWPTALSWPAPPTDLY